MSKEKTHDATAQDLNARLKAMHEAGATMTEMFQMALDMDTPVDRLADLSTFFGRYDTDTEGKHDWITLMFDAGCGIDMVRQVMLARFPITDNGFATALSAFFDDPSVWEILTPEQLLTVMQDNLQAYYSHQQQMVENRARLIAQLGTERATRLCYDAVTKGVVINQRVVQVMRPLPRDKQLYAIARGAVSQECWSYVVGVLNEAQPWFKPRYGSDAYNAAGRLCDHISRSRMRPAAYRWMLHAGVEPRSWLDQMLQDSLHGYHVAEVETYEGNLQVSIHKDRQTLLVFRHRDGERRDDVREGTRVIVPFNAPEGKRPVYQNGSIKIFTMEMHPVAPPTPVMLNDPRKYLYGR